MENKGVPKLYIGKDLCCGCTACYAVCPKSAIKMQEDEEGFERSEEHTSELQSH